MRLNPIIALFALAAGTGAHAGRETAVIPLLPTAAKQVAIEGRIGDQKGLFLFDSGWGLSSVTPETAKRIGCTPWGQLTGFRAIGERVNSRQCQPASVIAAHQRLPLSSVALVDMNRFMPPGSPDYAGALGLDAFAGRVITIRSNARQIVLEDAESLAARMSKAIPIPIRLQREMAGASLTAFVGIPTRSGELWMLLDTGNNGGTMIGRHAATLLGLDPSKDHGQTVAVLITTKVEFKGPVQVLDLIMDGNIGSDFLERWDLTLDLREGRGWLTPVESA